METVRAEEWTEEAQSHFASVYYWYIMRMGKRATDKFADGIAEDVKMLAKMPTVGRRYQKGSWSFVSHPRWRIVYEYDTSSITILAIRATQMRRRIRKTNQKNNA